MAAHLSDRMYAPLVCSNQMLVTGGAVITGCYLPGTPGEMIFHPPHEEGWLWTSTSSMMFRRAVLRYLVPTGQLDFMRCADGYLARGSHMLGGSIFLNRALVYRTIHADNCFITPDVIGMNAIGKRFDGGAAASHAAARALEAIIANHGEEFLPKLKAQTGGWQPKRKRTLAQRWARSARKRWARLVGAQIPA